MKIERVREILKKIQHVKISIYGDFCIDAYWMMDPSGSEISAETGLTAEAVRRQYYTPGGAANIVTNLAALQPKKIQLIGVIGDDIFGRELIRQFELLNVDTSSLFIQKENFDTLTFAKRYVEDQEQPRIDFGFRNKRSKETDDALLKSLKDALQKNYAVIFNQQVPGSITNRAFIKEANKLFQKYDDKIVLLDSRHYSDQFKNVFRKINELEAARLNNVNVQKNNHFSNKEVKYFAQQLYTKFNKPLIITRGSRGMVTIDADGINSIPGIRLLKKLDTVGAGDTVTCALALCFGAGIKLSESAEFSNLAAAVTVQKPFQTGAASVKEVLELCEDVSYVYLPELAENHRQAQYLQGTDIEICYDPETIHIGHIKHALFDHDGTISTLRQGWEDIMEQMMIQVILGDQYQSANENLYTRIRGHVREYIDKSMGIQTIVQMEDLVEMVKEFGFVPEDEILNRFGYKKIYNKALMETVNQRIARLKNCQLDIYDFTVKGAVKFLKLLKARGVKLYLASGTDCDDVINEAKVLGYAELFDGGIYGAVGDITKYSKKIVINKIMNNNHLGGQELAVFGDGPVELLECRKRGGIAIGIASDEIRRYGLNLEKRSRLVKAGAHFIVPDFSQYDELIKVLF